MCLNAQESLQDDTKAHKQHKSTWGKVIDIIQTRKDSLKKRSKKDLRIGSENSAHSTWTGDFQYSDDVSSPDDPPKDSVYKSCMRYEVAENFLC